MTHIKFIASEHSTANDSEFDFVTRNLPNAAEYPEAKLFIEQGDIVRSYREFILMNAPELFHLITNPVAGGVFSREFSEVTFERASHWWLASGRKVINFDIVGNLQKEALEFLLKNTTAEFAVEFVLTRFADITDYNIEQTRLLTVAAWNGIIEEKFLIKILDQLAPHYRDFWTGFQYRERRPFFHRTSDLVRERYMRWMISQQAREGDIILAHPAHIMAILGPEELLSSESH